MSLKPGIRHSRALDYPKIIAYILLARTNFARLFTLIHPEEQKFYKQCPNSWINLVINSLKSRVPSIDPSDSIIQIGIKNDEEDPKKGITFPKLTIEEWLLGMLQEVDRIVTDLEDSESMSELGDKTEEVGGKTTPCRNAQWASGL